MKSQYVLPITIVVAGVLIAGAVFLAGKSGTEPKPNTNPDGSFTARPYTPGVDHILGNPAAKVKVVEYADLECPYCKTFNTTMHQVMDYYGASGNVAWVYRPFPLTQIHSKAPVEAQAAECAADQGGDAAFFKYNDAVYEGTPYTLIMVGTEAVALNGAQPYDSMRAAIDAVLGDLGTASTTTQ